MNLLKQLLNNFKISKKLKQLLVAVAAIVIAATTYYQQSTNSNLTQTLIIEHQVNDYINNLKIKE